MGEVSAVSWASEELWRDFLKGEGMCLPNRSDLHKCVPIPVSSRYREHFPRG
jgi:hypothetical protein